MLTRKDLEDRKAACAADKAKAQQAVWMFGGAEQIITALLQEWNRREKLTEDAKRQAAAKAEEETALRNADAALNRPEAVGDQPA